MHPEVRNALVSCLKIAAGLLQPIAGQLCQPYLVWRRAGKGWQGSYEERPTLLCIPAHLQNPITDACTQFANLFIRHYPQYSDMAGTALGASDCMRNPLHIVYVLLSELWERYGTFQTEPSQLDNLLDEFSAFLKDTKIRAFGMAPLLNFDMEADRLALPAGIRIRRLTDEEISKLYGGPLLRSHFTNRQFGIRSEFALEASFEIEKVFGKQLYPESDGFNTVRDAFGSVVRALRTFKEGRTGFESIYVRAATFCPFTFGTVMSADLYIPGGTYHVSAHELQPLAQHVAHMTARLDSALETACSRLGDAETRLRPVDRILDAVIGLEAILLAAVKEEDRRGELRYRFALNYSTFFQSPDERYRAFKTARSMYDLRSAIAHGGQVEENPMIDGEKLTLDEVGRKACGLLRKLVKRFLPNGSHPAYRGDNYWNRSYFGL
jgi:hypothetical protein